MKECKKKCDFGSCFLCRFCLIDWLPAIDHHKQNFEVKKGQQIFTEGDPVKGIFFVFKGKVKVHKRWDEEKELIIRFANKGDILGQLGLGKNPVYPVSATALEPTIVCYLSMPFFESTLSVNTQFTYQLMRLFADDLQESEKRMRNLAHMPVKGRIAQAFLTLKDQFGTHEDGLIAIEITRQDIAAFAGVSYETLFKVTNDFIKDKLIELKGKSILISNEEKLLHIIKENPY